MNGMRLALALTGLTVLTRLPALLYQRAIDDEAVYAVVARVMLAGGLPYRDAIERKPPLLFAVYWAVLRLFGAGNWLALHLVAIAWILLTMAGLYVLTNRLSENSAPPSRHPRPDPIGVKIMQSCGRRIRASATTPQPPPLKRRGSKEPNIRTSVAKAPSSLEEGVGGGGGSQPTILQGQESILTPMGLAPGSRLFLLPRAKISGTPEQVRGDETKIAAPLGQAGAIAALAYTLVQPWATAKNLAFNGEVLMNLPLVWAYALVLRRPLAQFITPLAAGALLGTAFLLKQPAAIAAVPLGLYLLTAPIWRPDVRWRQAIAQAAALTTGFAAVLGAAMAILWRYGLLAEAWYWTMADHTVPHIFWQHGLEHTVLFVAIAFPLILPLAGWQPLRQACRGIEPELWTVVAWLAVSVIGAAAGGRFYPHYYIQIVPPLAVLAGVAYSTTRRPRRRFAVIWLTVAALGSVCVQTVQFLSERTPSPAARYVAAQARPTDRLFVWGQQSALYLDAGLLPASRYIATYPLTGYIFGGPLPGVSTRDRIVPGAWANLAADFHRHPPQFIIDTETNPGAAYPIRDFPMMAQRIARDYQKIATFPEGTIYRRR